MNTLFLIAFVFAAGAQAPAADLSPASAPGMNAALESYLRQAEETHPALAQHREAWFAALEEIPQSTSLDDPEFTYGQFLQSETQRAKLMLRQRFPWFGTLRERGNAAAARAEAALAQYHAVRDAVFFNVRREFYRYALLHEELALVRAQSSLLEQVQELVSTKLSLGLASEDELLRIATAMTRLEDTYQSLHEKAPAQSAVLAASVGAASRELLPRPEAVAAPAPPPPAPAAAARIRMTNPDLQTLDHRLAALEAQEALARKSGLPSFAVGFEYTAISKPRQIRPERPYPATLNAANRVLSTWTGQAPFSASAAAIDAYSLSTANQPFVDSDGGDDNFMVSLSVNVPIWRKRVRAAVAEAGHRQRAAEQEKQAMYLELEKRARMALFRARDGARRVELYDTGLLPQSEQTFESIQNRYAVGAEGAGFIDMLDSLDELLQFQLERAEAYTAWLVANAELEMLMGGAWEAKPEEAK